MRSGHWVLAAMSAFVLLLDVGLFAAQETDRPEPAEDAKPASLSSDEQDEPVGYPIKERDFDTPTDINEHLYNSFPKHDSVLPGLVPERWAEIKNRLYDKHGLKLGFSYQGIYQYASETLSGQDTASGGWILLEVKWDAVRRGKDFQGSIVMAVDGRHNLGSNAVPGQFRLDTGSLWTTDPAYFEWDPYVALAFWEQWFKRDRFALRIGQQSSLAVFDFFRFKDFRTSFSNSQLSAPVAIIPYGPPGPGLSLKWWPIESSELYVKCLIADINAPVGEWDWSTLTEFGQVFAGVEIGTNWRRGKGDFDHAHLDLWYGDAVDTASYPSDSGWGFKLHGSKQWGSWVGFANYGYNNAYGGGFGYTNIRQAVNAGFEYRKPLGIKGEVALALSWAEPLDRPDPLLGIQSDRNQYGIETYWKLLLTPDIWITPGVQLIVEPTFNPSTDLVAIPQFKFRAFF